MRVGKGSAAMTRFLGGFLITMSIAVAQDSLKIRVGMTGSSLRPDRPGGLSLKYGFQVTNESAAPVAVGRDEWGRDPVQRLGATKEWLYILLPGFQGVFVPDCAPTCAPLPPPPQPCQLLPPGDSFTVENKELLFRLAREVWNESGGILTLRIQMVTTCMKEDGIIKTSRIWSEPFTVVLPPKLGRK